MDVINRLYYELEAGDALLLPGFWLHPVRIVGASLAASQFNESQMSLAIGGGPSSTWRIRPYTRGWG